MRYNYGIDIIKVVDGDTIDANIDLGFNIKVKKRIRFMGINTPECRTRDLEEKKKGLAAKDRVKCLLEECDSVLLKSHGVGKYGRCLGELFIDMQGKLKNLNELLIEEGHAVVYLGGKR